MNHRLILICGIPASGKTTLIDRLIEKRDNFLYELLKIEPKEKINSCKAVDLYQRPELLRGTLVAHYDISERFKNNKFDFIEDYINENLNLTIVNLQASNKEYYSRYRYRYREIIINALNKLDISTALKNIKDYIYVSELFQKHNFIYENWVRELDDLGFESVIFLDSSNYDYRVL